MICVRLYSSVRAVFFQVFRKINGQRNHGAERRNPAALQYEPEKIIGRGAEEQDYVRVTPQIEIFESLR